ncbi:YciI family protein [Massilia sp. YMA4]
MTKFLISFPASAMDVPAEEMPAVAAASHAVIRAAKAAGVYVFAGGINAGVAPERVAADGGRTGTTYPQTARFDGGFCVLELPSRDAAVQWAARLAAACRCDQELREFHYDPES